MDLQAFNKALPQFNSIIVAYINQHVANNYLRTSPLGRYVFLSVDTKEGPLHMTVSFDTFYLVPVLYFLLNNRVGTSGGSIVENHPILHTPYQMIHPCETASTMALTQWRNPLEYLVMWFGFYIENVLPDIQLRVPSKVLEQGNREMEKDEVEDRGY